MPAQRKSKTDRLSGADLPTEAEMFRQIVITVETAWQNKLSRREVEAWLSNFKGRAFDLSYERRLALWLLCNFVYYNENEVRHLCRTAFREFLHFMLTTSTQDRSIPLQERITTVLTNTRFYHPGRVGESGAYVSYYFRQENGLAINHFLTQPDKIPDAVDTIVFVEDVVLSGSQTKRYLSRQTATYDAHKKKILLTFVCTEEAEKVLQELGFVVISCIKLDQRSRCFSAESNVFANHPAHREPCKKLAETYGAMLYAEHPLGFSNGQHVFGFFYNTPNNSLPIFWSEAGGWTPVMKRHDKVYGQGLHEFGRFI